MADNWGSTGRSGIWKHIALVWANREKGGRAVAIEDEEGLSWGQERTNSSEI